MRFEQFDPEVDDSQLRACHELAVSAHADDDPNVPAVSYGMFRSWWAHGFAGDPQQAWLVTSDSGEPLGCYLLGLPDRDNRSNGFLDPFVTLRARRRGIGTALVAHAARQADRADRALLMSNSRVGAPGAAFAAAVGARPCLRDARRVLNVCPDVRGQLTGRPGLPGRLDELRAEAEQHAAGYELRRWTGSTPADLTDAVCALYSAMEDAPHEPSVEPLSWDADRLRRSDERAVAAGSRLYSLAAIHAASGEMAALTQVYVDPATDGWAFQDITAVTRPHRGHRLGLLLKVVMLQWLAGCEAHVRQIMTFNAVQNEHMVAVNTRLGFRVTDYFESFELDVAGALTLGTRTALAGPG